MQLTTHNLKLKIEKNYNMADIENKITQLCPQAQVDCTGEFPLVTVADAQWHELACALKDKLHYDVLSALVGMDWTEAYGCVYYLTNTSTHELLHVKVTAPEKLEIVTPVSP